MKLKFIFITIFVSAVCVGLVWSMMAINGDSNEICQKVVVDIKPIKGDKYYLSKHKVDSVLKANKIYAESKKRAEIDLPKIRTTIENNLAVKKAKCYFVKNGDLRIDVIQRTPLFKVAGNKTYYVEDDKDRTIFQIPSNFDVGVPIVTGYFADSVAQKDIFNFVTFLQKNSFFAEKINKIHCKNNFVKFTLKGENFTIVVGNLKNRHLIYDFEEKLNRFKDFYNKEILDKKKTYSEIDLQFDKQIVCR